MPYQDVWKIIWKKTKKQREISNLFFHYFCYIGRENNKILKLSLSGGLYLPSTFAREK
jgi:hypothetical protein